MIADTHAHVVAAVLAKELVSAADARAATSGLTLNVDVLLLGDLRLQLGNLLLLLLDRHLKLNTVDATIALNALLSVLQLLNGVQ